MDGILVIDKPIGPTSHGVVSAARRILKQKKIGHTGTLDPAATGVLPLVIGKATKLAQYLSASEKSYYAVVRLGVTTTTLDAQGETLETKPVHVSVEQVRETLLSFLGESQQIPPMYSAKKVNGKRLYQLAREGVDIEREPRTIHLLNIDFISYENERVTFEVKCSAGTYIRVLAQDLGLKLGCGGHLESLRRLTAGMFDLGQAVTLDALEKDPELVHRYLISPEFVREQLNQKSDATRV